MLPLAQEEKQQTKIRRLQTPPSDTQHMVDRKPPYTKRKRHKTPEADTSADAVARKLWRNKIFHGPTNGGTIAPNSTVGRNQGIPAIFILPPSKGRTRRHLIG
jgi:hypothetical protein